MRCSPPLSFAGEGAHRDPHGISDREFRATGCLTTCRGLSGFGLLLDALDDVIDSSPSK